MFMSHTISLCRWPYFPRASSQFLQPQVSRVLLKIFAVPNKQVFCINVMIPGVPILLTHIFRCLLTAPRTPITTGMTDTLLRVDEVICKLLAAFLFFCPIFVIIIIIIIIIIYLLEMTMTMI